MLKGYTILLLGGAGFIGMNLAERLGKDNRVISLDLKDSPRGEPIVADVTQKGWYERVAAKGPIDIIFYLASVVGVDYAGSNPYKTSTNEIEGIYNTLEFARQYGVQKIVYASSSSVYEAIEMPTAYNTAKLYAEQCVRDSELDYLILRYFNVYGRYQSPKMVLSRFIQNAINNEPLVVYGDGGQTRDFTYVDDAIDATIELTASSQGKNETVDIGTGVQTTILSLAEKVKSVTHSASQVVKKPAPDVRVPYEVKQRVSDPGKLQKLLGWQCDTSLDEGIVRTLEEYKRISNEADSE